MKQVTPRAEARGKFNTTFVFQPAAASSLMKNNYWLHLKMEHMTIFGATSGSTFMQSYTLNSAQGYYFNNVFWKNFLYVFQLEGNNNNSEFMFLNCRTSGLQAGRAWLYISAANATDSNSPGDADQFLNYWFYGCAHWSTSAALIDAAWGGHFKIYGLDASDFAPGVVTPVYLISLRGFTHARGVTHCIVDGLRVEPKSTVANLLYSEWPSGNVSFRNTDFSSQAGTYTYGDTIVLNLQNVDGAIYDFHDCSLAGGVNVKFGTNSFQHQPRIKFLNCNWYGTVRKTPTEVVSYDTSTAGSNLVYPPVSFESCRGGLVDITSAAGAAVWDATVGYYGNPLQTLRKWTISVRGGATGSLPNNSTVSTVVLPMNALITDIEVMSPAGASSDTGGGSFILSTTDSTPVTIATATISNAMNAGFRVPVALSIPFRCDTDTRRTVTVTSSNVAAINRQGLFLVSGYW